MCFKAMEEARGDLGRLQASWRNILITKYTQLGEERGVSKVAAKFHVAGRLRPSCT